MAVTVVDPEVATDRPDPPREPRRAASGPSRRVVLVGVGILMILTFVRGLFWVVSVPVWYGDEGAHYAYEQSVATGHGVPVAGRSLNSADTLHLIKDSPVATERTWPIPPTPSLRWGIVDEQYEGLQSPLYYLLLVPAFWVGRAVGGLVGSFYALRLASLCLAVAAIPLVALLARALVPGRRAIWLLAPAVIAALQIVNVQNSYVDNDALTVVAGATCLLALLACRGDLRVRPGRPLRRHPGGRTPHQGQLGDTAPRPGHRHGGLRGAPATRPTAGGGLGGRGGRHRRRDRPPLPRLQPDRVPRHQRRPVRPP